MPKQRKNRFVAGQYFQWKIYRRGQVFYADGRSNKISAGKHSLGTTDPDEVQTLLYQLDLKKAIELGLAEPKATPAYTPSISIVDGLDRYRDYCARPIVRGGVREGTLKRYRAACDKFRVFTSERGCTTWEQVDRALLDAYSRNLEKKKYADCTIYLELTFLKQVIKWLVAEKKLASSCLFPYPLKKTLDTTTYCWTKQEVEAILSHTDAQPALHWLRDILTGLTMTGLRISELGSLSWDQVDLAKGEIRLAAQNTKTKRSRVIPINRELQNLLERLPRFSDGLVFHGPQGGRVKPDKVRTKLVHRVLKPLAARFPKEGKGKSFIDGRLHSFRHYFCSTCANSHVPELTVRNWLGHRDSRMIDRYYHADRDLAKQQIDAVEFIQREVGSTVLSAHQVEAASDEKRHREEERNDNGSARLRILSQ